MILNYLKRITFVCGIILLSLLISGNSVFADKGGKPFDNLQQQIDELKLRVESLEQVPTGTIGVYDANGQYLGDLVSTINPGLIIYLTTVQATLNINYTGDDRNSQAELYFENNDCTSPPYHFPSVQHTDLISNNLKFYKAKSTSQYSVINYNATMNTNGYCDSSSIGTMVAIELEEVFLPFTFPVATPLRLE